MQACSGDMVARPGTTSGKAGAVPPTILQIIPRLDTGGAELSTVEIAAAIVKAGARAMVATEGGRLAPQITAAGGTLVPLPLSSKNPATMALNVGRLVDLIRREGVSLVHARSRAPAWSALLAARRALVPFVTTYHGAYNEQNAAKRLYNSVMARGDVVIANSTYTRDLILERYRTPPDRVRVIYRGVDAASFDPAVVSPARLDALRSAWGITSGSRVVLKAARLTAWKGQADLIEAVRRLGAAPDVAVILAGDAQGRSAYSRELERSIAVAGLESTVRLVGHCSDMPAAFALAHVAIIASNEPEAFGRTATEAQAACCPVIATNIGAPPETVRAEPRFRRDETTGWLVPPAAPDAMAAALRLALALTPTERRDIGHRARQNASLRFSLRGMQRQTLEVYDDLLGLAGDAKLAAGFERAYA